MSHFFESGVFNRRGAWHGLGEVWTPQYEDDFLDWLTALQLSGLDWEVIKEPIYRNGKDTGKFWTVRTKDDQEFGVVGKQYEVIQNVQGFKYLDQLLEAGELEIETAIAIYGGRTVTILARKPEGIKLGAEGEVLDTFIGFTNRHDGMGACKVFTCRERVVCANTQAVAEGEFKKSGRHWSIRHQGDTELKLAEAREALQLSFEEDEKYAEAMNQLMTQPLGGTERYSRNMKEILGFRQIDKAKQPRKYRNAVQTATRINEIRKTVPDLQNHNNNDYGFYQAITYYETHEKKYRNEGTKFQNLAVEGGELTNRAFSVLTAS